MTSTRQKSLKWLTAVMFGAAETPEQRMHLTFLFIAPWGCYFSAVFDAAVGITGTLYVAVLLSIGLAVHALWFQARRSLRPHGMAALFCLLMLFVVLPLSWFDNEGADGPTLLLFLLLAAYALGAIVLRPWQRAALIASFVVVPTVLLITGYRHPTWVPTYADPQQRLLDLGVSYTFSVALLVVLMGGYLRRFENEHRDARDTARRDSLTGLLNHGAFHGILNQYELERPLDSRAILLTYDLDHFKQVNDTYGHAYGDEVLCHFSQLLDETVADYAGVAGRCGGEEFNLFIPYATRDDIVALDSRLREQCLKRPLRHGPVCFSGGAALDSAETFSVDEWLARSDTALYAAKSGGRNRSLFDDGQPMAIMPTDTR
ncbi:diguanylate cyclase [Salinisphaera sp. SWV1]|uniref:GGDEF domain-containing protein n=1 Tax=Salinisphaera sp. SWV1 TaxID=3454139 RepID=UPI003F8776AB